MVCLIGYGSVGNLYQRRFEVNSRTRDPDRLLLAGRLIVTGGKTRPAIKAFRRTKLGHIHTDFRDDRDCGAAVSARDSTEERNSPIILLDHGVDADIHPLNQLLNEVEMVTDDANTIFLFRRDLITRNRSENVIRLFLAGTL